jgi:DNA topoisomerase-1
MNKLLIVESYTKTNTIKKYLNDPTFIVTHSSGHVYNLPKDKIGFDTNTWDLEYIKTNPKIINNIREYVSKSDIIYIATDPDLEGETIAYNIKDSIRDLIKKNKQCYRVSFNEITENAVKNAINNPKDIDMNIVNAQETRRIVDRMIGYKVSPILWSKFNKNYLSSGRVQNAALIICINQRNKILNNEIKPVWNIDCKFIFDKDKKKFLISTLVTPKNIEDVNNIKKILGELKTNVKYTISYEMKKRFVSPPPPYTTTSLQQECYNKFKWSAKITMKLAQELYENGVITYIRTDSTNICKEAKNTIINYIKCNYDSSYAKYRTYSSNINNAQEAHEAIRATNPVITTCNFQNNTSNHNKLYDIIRKRTIASLMSDAEYVDICCKFTTDKNNYEFTCIQSFMKFEGFKIIYDEKIECTEDFIKMLKEECYSYEYKCNGSINNVPTMYNEVQLIKHLEKEGIGRPSTYASIIDKLIEKKYVTIGANPQHEYKIENFIKKYKSNDINTELKTINLGGKSKDLLIPTELGIEVIKYIFEVLPYLCDLKFTSNMEKDLDDIINLKNNKKTILDDIYNKISKSLKSIGIDDTIGKKNEKNIKLNKEDYKDGIVKTRYGICYYNKSKDTYTNVEPYLKWKGKDANNLDSTDIKFLSSLPKEVVYLNMPYKLHIGRYGLYLKDDKNVNHKIEKKIWNTFI